MSCVSMAAVASRVMCAAQRSDASRRASRRGVLAGTLVAAVPLPARALDVEALQEAVRDSNVDILRMADPRKYMNPAEIELERKCASEQECALEYEELDEWGSERLRDTILELQGFYVKSGQVLSTRVDLFAEPYTDKLQILQDGLEAIPTDVVKEVVRVELCGPTGSLDELFSDFEEEPLGCASIAQVHGATLLDGRRVAVKVQRPGARPLLLADLANLKRFSKLLADALPVDYYVVFSELGEVLEAELDFLQEAQAMEKLGAAVAFAPDGSETPPPLVIPRPVPGLVSPKVLVMDFNLLWRESFQC